MKILALLLCLTLPACGWQFRGEVAPLMLDTVALRGAEARTRYDIESALLKRDVLVADAAPMILQLSQERWWKRTVVIDAQGRSAGVELRYEIQWQLLDPAGPPLTSRREVALTRVYQVDPTNALATSDEEQLTRDIMRRDAAELLMQQLSAESARLSVPVTREGY
ncbi:MAG: LPS assembly lipoprotein LptE [Alcanivoracaceae bacterium]|jgi:outer membrane lipopolysaccharide assembly protein LptE/RlpB|nr:LPS assembly lipoprotein LptE [Alcanivoracaceae bacterium]